MSIFEYDQERHIKQEREDAWEEGRKAGKRDMLWKLAEKKLRKGKTITMSIFEYDQERHIKQEREDAWEEGRKAGKRDMLWKLAEKKLRKGKTITEIAEELEESEETIKDILDSRKE